MVLEGYAAGGGGKGMRVVQQLDGLSDEIESAMREAKSAFGDPALIVEAFVDRALTSRCKSSAMGAGRCFTCSSANARVSGAIRK